MTHRGPHPQDARDFRDDALAVLREAVADLSWLLGRGYSDTAALALVGDRSQLSKRQRMAVRRCACSDASLARRRDAHQEALSGAVWVDGFNVLVALERALGGGPVLVGRDGAIRDLGGVHGTWRPVDETPRAIGLVAPLLAGARVTWLLDAPVSNSGRLAAALRAAGDWEVELVPSPDRLLVDTEAIAVTSDGWILDHARRWHNLLARALPPGAWRVDLRPD